MHHGLDIEDSNVNVLFPRLIAMRTVNVAATMMGRDQRLVTLAGAVMERNNRLISRIEVFRPLSLDNIHHLFDVDCRISSAQDPCWHKYVCIYDILDDLVVLTFKEGGYLVASTFQDCTSFERNWARQGRGNISEEALEVNISSKEPNDNIDTTIQLVFEIMTYSTRPDRRRPFLGSSMKRGLTVNCSRWVFESFVHLASR
jgi:hypothetical protein